MKFGRMSKKQREKVEDEVRYHKEMNSQQAQRDAATGLNLNGGSGSIGSASTTGSGNGNHGSGSSPDSSVFDPPQPSSTEHMYGGGGFPYDSGKNIFLNYSTVKLGIKKLLNKEQIGFSDYQPFYTINLIYNEELLSI